MQNEYKVKVYPCDTDKFDVAWHGTYFRWLEAARVELFEAINISFKTLDELGIALPVVEIDVKYKQSARAYDELVVITSIEQLNRTNVVFAQEIKKIDTGQLLLSAKVKNVAVDENGKLYRTLPEYIREKISLN